MVFMSAFVKVYSPRSGVVRGWRDCHGPNRPFVSIRPSGLGLASVAWNCAPLCSPYP
jgi:hypothetical protein